MSNLHHTMSQMSDPYLAVLEMLKAQAENIKQSGPVAPAGVWLDKYAPGKGRPTYVRKRSEQPLWEGKKTKSLGQLDSDEHRAFELAIIRRNALQAIERRTVAIQTMIDAPVWSPEQPKTPGEQYNNPQLDALLSRGYSLHSEEDAADGILILLHERSRILWRFNLRTGRNVSLGLAEADITVFSLDQTSYVPPGKKTRKAKSVISYAFKGGKGATPMNRIVHALASEEPTLGRWFGKALCGAEPKHSLKNWGWVSCHPSDFSCPKCARKLAKR